MWHFKGSVNTRYPLYPSSYTSEHALKFTIVMYLVPKIKGGGGSSGERGSTALCSFLSRGFVEGKVELQEEQERSSLSGHCDKIWTRLFHTRNWKSQSRTKVCVGIGDNYTVRYRNPNVILM